ncbi:MAG: hypothetical protein IPL62_08155 [Caulobacteraceae bacterium]|nr:hypothetical protein [Caulobacteraceae bacterium]
MARAADGQQGARRPLANTASRCSSALQRRGRRASDQNDGSCAIPDPEVLNDGFGRDVLLDHCDATLDLDVTSLAPSEAAVEITRWLNAGGHARGRRSAGAFMLLNAHVCIRLRPAHPSNYSNGWRAQFVP